MRMKAKIVKTFQDGRKMRALASVYLDDGFLVTGVRIIESHKGPAVIMPARKNRHGEYRDICFPFTPACRKQFVNTVLNAYDLYVKVTEEYEV